MVEALPTAGAGRVGAYARCHSVRKASGSRQVLPGSRSFLGDVGGDAAQWGCRIESVCDAEQAGSVRQAVRDAHPYEEPVIRFPPLYEP